MRSFPYLLVNISFMRNASELFRENLKKIRKSKGLSQITLATNADLSPGLVGDIEAGRRNPTLTSIEKIANALEIPVQQLFFDSEADYADSALDSKEELRSVLHKLVDKAIDS